MTATDLSKFVKDQALKLGFDACGIAIAHQIHDSQIAFYDRWLEANFQAEMHYMNKNSEKRYDPRLLVEGCRSIIVVALNYEPFEKQHQNAPKIARFAYGEDYHNIIRDKLKKLLQIVREQGITVNGRAFADSAPVAERYWAEQSGLGWMGKNHQLIIPQKGSYFFLGELMVDIELEYDVPLNKHCGNCTRCLEACPTKALGTNGLDSRRCLSYLTIEKHEPFNDMESALISDNEYIFGCDICQEACPWNRFSKTNTTPELKANALLCSMEKMDFENQTVEGFNELFNGTCLERTGYERIQRNLKALKKPDHR